MLLLPRDLAEPAGHVPQGRREGRQRGAPAHAAHLHGAQGQVLHEGGAVPDEAAARGRGSQCYLQTDALLRSYVNNRAVLRTPEALPPQRGRVLRVGHGPAAGGAAQHSGSPRPAWRGGHRSPPTEPKISARLFHAVSSLRTISLCQCVAAVTPADRQFQLGEALKPLSLQERQRCGRALSCPKPGR